MSTRFPHLATVGTIPVPRYTSSAVPVPRSTISAVPLPRPTTSAVPLPQYHFHGSSFTILISGHHIATCKWGASFAQEASSMIAELSMSSRKSPSRVQRSYPRRLHQVPWCTFIYKYIYYNICVYNKTFLAPPDREFRKIVSKPLGDQLIHPRQEIPEIPVAEGHRSIFRNC